MGTADILLKHLNYDAIEYVQEEGIVKDNTFK